MDECEWIALVPHSETRFGNATIWMGIDDAGGERYVVTADIAGMSAQPILKVNRGAKEAWKAWKSWHRYMKELLKKNADHV